MRLRSMQRRRISRFARSHVAALLAIVMLATPAVAADITLEDDVKGCNGVLPSNDGNTDMRLVGGTLRPGGTAVFEITYPLNSSSIGKKFTITACAFINGVATLKYLVSFVPSNQSFVLRMEFAVPADAPVGGRYCNYAKTTRSPTAAQASQRKAGPSCFIIQGPSTPNTQPPRPRPNRGPTPSRGGGSTPFLPDTAMGH